MTNQFSSFVDNCGMTQSIAFIRCGSKEEAEKISKDLDAPIYKFINNLARYGNFNNERILQRLPKLDKISLTDEEYYKSKKGDKNGKSSEAPSKYAERFLNKDFIEKYNKKPIGCTQK